MKPLKAESTYSRIVENAILSVRQEAGLKNKVRSITREFKALGTYTRYRFTAMSPLRRALTYVLAVFCGAAVALTIRFLLLHPNPAGLRENVRSAIAHQNFLGAKNALEELRTVEGRLTEEDRFKLAAPVQIGLQKTATKLFARVETARAASHLGEAIATLDEIERLGVEVPRTIFVRAELLRQSLRSDEAAQQYARYIGLFPDTDQTDDAMFWRASILVEQGKNAEARRLLGEIVTRFPQSEFMVSTRRLLTRVGAAPSP